MNALTDLDHWFFFVLGAVGMGLPVVWLTVRSAVKSGNSILVERVDNLRGYVNRELEIVRKAETTIREVANRAEKKVDDLTSRVSMLEGQGED